MKNQLSLYRTMAVARNTGRSFVTAGVLIVTLTAAMCGGPSPAVLKGAVAAFGPFIAYEIAQGRITPEKAKLYTDDANALIDGYGRLTNAWSAATTRADKAAAIQTFVNEIAPIVNDFAKLPQLQTALLIFNTALAVIQAFYGGSPPSLAPGVSVQMPKTEGELKKYLEVQSQRLKAALAHP